MNDAFSPYVMIEDSNGAIAFVYYRDDQKHEIHYKNHDGKKFFTETFDSIPIEFVEKLTMEWATGKRELA